MDLTIDYNEQMLNYYPEVIKAVREFQILIESQSEQIEDVHQELTNILANAYISTADEERISEWERFLGITPLPQGEDDLETWLSDRRDTIKARLYQTQKLNTKSISEIVRIFTGGSAISYFKDGTIYIAITPPPKNKLYKFTNVEQEIGKMIPAHLKFEVSRNYFTWNEINENHSSWGDVKDNQATWEDVFLFVPFA